MRLDQAVSARFPEISRRKARELIAARRVLVNDRPVAVASRHVPDDARIVIADEVADLDVIAETNSWIAINKPAGLPTQPARDRKERSLEELLRIRYREIYVVHRLDTPTSGVVVFARTREAAAELSRPFSAGEMRKTYLAIVEGTIDGELTIDAPIARTGETSFSTAETGKEAQTIVRPLRALEDRTLVEVHISTGRTHQIRVHLASIGHPVVGDRKYGSGASAPRLMLHAWKLEHTAIGQLAAAVPAEFEM